MVNKSVHICLFAHFDAIVFLSVTTTVLTRPCLCVVFVVFVFVLMCFQFQVHVSLVLINIVQATNIYLCNTPLQNPFLDEMFDNLQILCNIFIVKADNLKQVCSEDPYVSPFCARGWDLCKYLINP